MDTMYTIIVLILGVLAVSGLIVGVANDAVNFLTSALGSKAAPRYVIMTVASIGILIGTITSSGMMEIARSGVFFPQSFTFHEMMMLFLAVMIANVILLDLFNTFGLPTSTTVSLVFGLLGAGIGVAAVKISGSPDFTASDLGHFINSGKALAIISAILVSVVLAFLSGIFVMYLTRFLFTFRYKVPLRRVGAIWCGFAFTVITYFALIKGLKDSALLSAQTLDWINHNTTTLLACLFVGWTALMAFVQFVIKGNILKLTVLAGTFSLALAFAGNDLVNFIGVPVAGYDAFYIAKATGDPNMTMEALAGAVKTPIIFQIAAGIIMVLTLWFSKKARHVTETELNLTKQDEGAEKFGSTLMSRAVVRLALGLSKSIDSVIPKHIQKIINKRFTPVKSEDRDKAHFDLMRATVNLTVASLLISLATSLKLPLSTTYVTFMVAMGTSLADRAWGRESAVYRITGVLTVISGWFVTAVIAFIIAAGVALGLMYGGMWGVGIATVLCFYMLIHSAMVHSKKERKKREEMAEIGAQEDKEETVLQKCQYEVTHTMSEVTYIYKKTMLALFKEDRKTLKTMVKESDDLFYQARERKYEIMPTLLKLQEDYINTGHYYVQVVDYLNELTKALVHITRPSFEHIDNNHEGFSKEQVADLIEVNKAVANIYERINRMLVTNDFTEVDDVLMMRDQLFDDIAEAMKRQLKRIKSKTTSTKASMLYLTILNETKTMVLQSRNLLKSQKHFFEANEADKIEA